jgi:hypothetical protein
MVHYNQTAKGDSCALGDSADGYNRLNRSAIASARALAPSRAKAYAAAPAMAR